MAVPRIIEAERLSFPANSPWRRLPLVAGVLGVLGVALSLGTGQGRQLWFSWLVAFLFFLSIALGGLFFVLVHFVTKAAWGVTVRRLAENLAATLPLFALLFLPLVGGLEELYAWAAPDAAEDHLLRAKAPYLDRGFFLLRAAIYFAVWSAIGLGYLRSSRRQDASGDEQITRRLNAWSGPGLLLFALTTSFAAIDWIMTLEPHWYSTIFGVYYFAGCLVAVFATLVLLSAALVRAGVLRDVVTVEHFHDLGKLLFAFTVFWAYIAFSQFFLIWYGNIPEETVWYLRRIEGGWLPVSLLLAAGHFLVPFFYLMSRTVKRRTAWLVAGATWMIAMHLLDVYWMVMPTLHETGPRFAALDALAFLGVGGLFVAVVSWLLVRQPVVPVRDPRLAESLGFENF